MTDDRERLTRVAPRGVIEDGEHARSDLVSVLAARDPSGELAAEPLAQERLEERGVVRSSSLIADVVLL